MTKNVKNSNEWMVAGEFDQIFFLITFIYQSVTSTFSNLYIREWLSINAEIFLCYMFFENEFWFKYVPRPLSHLLYFSCRESAIIISNFRSCTNCYANKSRYCMYVFMFYLRDKFNSPCIWNIWVILFVLMLFWTKPKLETFSHWCLFSITNIVCCRINFDLFLCHQTDLLAFMLVAKKNFS